MSSSPLPIRRAGPGDTLTRGAKDQLVVTPSGHLYGSTPGGTRIVYSREQLLSLASSPLSKTPPHIPAEISRSPDKNGHVLVGSYRSNGSHGSAGRGVMDKAGHSPAAQVFGSSHQNGNGGQAAARSPQNFSRSPGNAFNFANQSMSPNGVNHSTSFKERLASAQQQQPSHTSPVSRRAPQSGSDGTQPSSSNGGIKGETNGATHGEEQFSMDM